MSTTAVQKKVIVTDFVMNSTPSGTVFDVGALPGGHRVLSAAIYTPAAGTGVTLALGDSGSSTRYVAAASAVSAAKLAMTDTLAGGVGYQVVTSTRLLVTTGGATTSAGPLTGTVVIELAEEYA